MENTTGKIIISLDFELLWGIKEFETKETWGKRITNARDAIDKLLVLFDKYELHATWATIGLLLAESKEEQVSFSPLLKPSYNNKKLSSYNYFNDVGENEKEDIFYFANSIVKKILERKNQEIGSHTFSHYYCLAKGQNILEFKADLEAAIKITQDKHGFSPTSLVLPKNNYREDYMEIAQLLGFKSVRGNPKHYAYNSWSSIARALRLIDSYINILGKKCYSYKELKTDGIINLRASRFYRQYSKKLKIFEPLKLHCIKKQMKYAAKHNKIFHFWWHPHNLGGNPEICLAQLEEIFKYYKYLNKKYNFESVNMKEMVGIINENSAFMR